MCFDINDFHHMYIILNIEDEDGDLRTKPLSIRELYNRRARMGTLPMNLIPNQNKQQSSISVEDNFVNKDNKSYNNRDVNFKAINPISEISLFDGDIEQLTLADTKRYAFTYVQLLLALFIIFSIIIIIITIYYYIL